MHRLTQICSFLLLHIRVYVQAAIAAIPEHVHQWKSWECI